MKLLAKKSSHKENTKTKAESQVSGSEKSRGTVAQMQIRVNMYFIQINYSNLFLSGSSDPSSEDEPLINLVKKRQMQSKVKTREKKDTRPRRLEEKLVTGKDSNGMQFGNMACKIKIPSL